MMPWFIIRQTLRVGNAASMLNGMVKLLLAKMNISTVTQWFGAAKSDKGMNLLQQYSLSLSYPAPILTSTELSLLYWDGIIVS